MTLRSGTRSSAQRSSSESFGKSGEGIGSAEIVHIKTEDLNSVDRQDERPGGLQGDTKALLEDQSIWRFIPQRPPIEPVVGLHFCRGSSREDVNDIFVSRKYGFDGCVRRAVGLTCRGCRWHTVL